MSNTLSKPVTRARRLELPSDQEASGRSLGDEEIGMLVEAIRSGTLTSTKGKMVKTLEERFAEILGVSAAHACSSGTAAIHTAVAAIDPEPGDEIVTTSITDMGAITPILYQGAIPVFADVDADTCNMTAETIEPVLSDRTRAIIVTHLFGNPCRMGPIMDLARSRGIPVIEDCAQAYLSRWQDEPVGAIGDIGCFSLQQGKHITTGEGGLVTAKRSDLARRMFLFINKAWGYGDAKADHYFLALNYRMNELTGAVAAAQLDKLSLAVNQRIVMADRLTAAIADLPGVKPPLVDPQGVHTYWKYCLRVDGSVLPGGADALGRLLKERGIACAPRYIQKRPSCARCFAISGPSATAVFPSRSPGRKRSITIPRDSRARLPRWNRCSCCRGTSVIPRRTSTGSPRQFKNRCRSWGLEARG